MNNKHYIMIIKFVIFALLLFGQLSCASKQNKKDIQMIDQNVDKIEKILEKVTINQDGLNKELIKNQMETLEIEERLSALKLNGKDNTEEAINLKYRLEVLGTELLSINEKIDKIDKKVNKNEKNIKESNISNIQKKKIINEHTNEWKKIEEDTKNRRKPLIEVP